jgi:choline transport protein
MAVEDDAQLAALGYTAELPRNLSTLSLLGLAFVILNSWSVLASSLPLSLTLGLSSSVVWGLLIVGLGNICLAASLAEFLSAYPTAGLSSPLSWVAGWLTTFGWITVTASAALMGSQLFLGLLYSRDPGHSPSRLIQYFLYIIFTLIGLANNYWMSSKLPTLNKAAWYWSILGFVAVPTIGYLFSVQPLADASFVFGYFDNRTGWPGKSETAVGDPRLSNPDLSDAIAWPLGFLQAAVALNGFDAVAHM